MPVMSGIEQVFCRSLPWRSFSRRLVFPWSLGTDELRGSVLELGCGSGAMAAELLDRYPSMRLVASDVDPAMRTSARRRLAKYGDRIHICAADATSLPFPDGTFDAVVTFIMLHHVIAWETALDEATRVLRDGGILVGYDLLDSRVARTIHRLDGSSYRLTTAAALDQRLTELELHTVSLSTGLHGHVARFRALRARRQLVGAPE